MGDWHPTEIIGSSPLTAETIACAASKAARSFGKRPPEVLVAFVADMFLEDGYSLRGSVVAVGERAETAPKFVPGHEYEAGWRRRRFRVVK